MTDDSLPPLPFEEWEPTKDTLHLWAQIIGKTRQALMPMRNHWWNVTLSPSARGLTTRRMPVEARNLEIEIDLVGHRLAARTTESEAGFALHDGLSVADFRQHLDGALKALDVNVAIRDEPFGVPTTTPFSSDRAHASYDADAVARFLRVLQWSTDVLEEFAGWYCGKTSPVHLFWHSFDVATGRFSGKRAGTAPGADAVTAEAYSHEIISFGFWAGDRNNPFPAYYSYTAPEPSGIRDRRCARRAPNGSPPGPAPSRSSGTTARAAPPIRGRRFSSSCRARSRRARRWLAGISPTRRPTGALSRPTASSASAARASSQADRSSPPPRRSDNAHVHDVVSGGSGDPSPVRTA